MMNRTSIHPLTVALILLGAVEANHPAAAQTEDVDAAAPAMMQAGAMTEMELRATMAQQGYTFVHNLQFRNDGWLAEADSPDGRSVKVRIDARSGQVTPLATVAKTTTDAVILIMLARGYRKITNVRMSGGFWHAQALALDGQVVQLTLDPADGRIVNGG